MKDINLCFIKLFFTLSYSRKQSHSLHLILWVTSVRLPTRLYNKFSINLALSINYVLEDIVKTLSLPLTSIFVTYFFIDTKSFSFYSVFCPRDSMFSSYSFVNSFVKNDNHNLNHYEKLQWLHWVHEILNFSSFFVNGKSFSFSKSIIFLSVVLKDYKFLSDNLFCDIKCVCFLCDQMT